MRKYIIEVEEKRAEAVVNLLAEISIKVGNPTEEKKHYVKIDDTYGSNDNFLCLTEEQFSLLRWLSNEDCFNEWEEVNPNEMFKEI